MRLTAEAYLDWMTGVGGERPIFTELFGPLIGLDAQWRVQGAVDSAIDMTGWGWDWVERVCVGHTGVMGGYEPKVLEDTEEYRLERDALGRTMKLPKQVATIALPLDYPVKNMDDWLKIKSWFAWRDDRVTDAMIDHASERQADGALAMMTIPGAYDLPRQLMGDEVACMAYYDQPELIADIMATIKDTALRVAETLSSRMRVDYLFVHEDMAGRSGPLVGPQQVSEWFKPYFKPIWELLQSRGARIFSMDSDGNMNPIIDALLDCGLTQLYPLEPAAGMDLVELRKQYGNRLIVKGGIDKFALRRDKAAIREELEYKMAAEVWSGGGVCYGLDHRIPDGTSLENYRYYVELGREMLGMAPLSEAESGWQPMAF